MYEDREIATMIYWSILGVDSDSLDSSKKEIIITGIVKGMEYAREESEKLRKQLLEEGLMKS